MSSEMLSQHVQQMAHMKKKTKDDLDPLYDVKKKEQVSFGFTFHQLFIVCKWFIFKGRSRCQIFQDSTPNFGTDLA